jgi:hypothetical protein
MHVGVQGVARKTKAVVDLNGGPPHFCLNLDLHDLEDFLIFMKERWEIINVGKSRNPLNQANQGSDNGLGTDYRERCLSRHFPLAQASM